MSGMTMMSWNSSAPSARRPWASVAMFCSSKIWLMMAVEDIAAAPPTASPSPQPPPASTVSSVTAAAVKATCIPPNRKTCRRMARNSAMLNFSPMVNISRVTPMSPANCASALSSRTPRALGPARMPTAK